MALPWRGAVSPELFNMYILKSSLPGLTTGGIAGGSVLACCLHKTPIPAPLQEKIKVSGSG
ncbi:hypothetical protein [Sporomusa termitida]|uniref:Uncharacterized protein n=1 Tax=Sporomusa termitida TaxID=2377 RepID=A0A517DQN3_9FIRM|nr:hypothetical protein [Sporomusa termitida]QDR79660.1 hypothetical protein SPTER_09490 [Sporomusa termitida]